MGIYHCSIQVIGRNSGRSAVASAAYRSGEKLVNEYDGIEHDFRKKNWIEYTEIMLPDNAPSEYSDRNTLWNVVEKTEKSKDAQLCREFELAIPLEFNKEQQIEIVRQFARDVLVADGMIVDIAIHSPPVCNDRHQPIAADGSPTKDRERMQFINPHAHILATMRPIDENGKWVAKTQKEYLCKRFGEERGFTAEEYKCEKNNGWKKQYKYENGKKTVWLTSEEAKTLGLEKINSNPKTKPYGRKNPKIESWSSKDSIYKWRQAWEKTVNDKYASIGMNNRIDCRSFKNQGKNDEIPTIHMGPSAINMERRAKREVYEGKNEDEVLHSDIGTINMKIKEYNRFVYVIKEKLATLADKAKKHVEKITSTLQSLVESIVAKRYEKALQESVISSIEAKITNIADRLDKYDMVLDNVKTANRNTQEMIASLEKELKECRVFQFNKKKALSEEIDKNKAIIRERENYLSRIQKMCGYSSIEALEADKKNLTKCELLLSQNNKNNVDEEIKTLEEEYERIIKSLPSKNKKDIMKCSLWGNNNMKEMMMKKYGLGFDVDLLERVQKEAANELSKEQSYINNKRKCKSA